MSTYLTIDSGTTNTRICLVRDRVVVDTAKYPVGAGKSMENRTLLKETIKRGIDDLLCKHCVKPSEVRRILASGMITSEFGLCRLEHIQTPVGLKELHEASETVVIEGVSDIPFTFMRGVKTNCDRPENADMMRGEETELMGLMSSDDGACMYILPGSHSKLIQTDLNGRIVSFSTMLTGEMIAALSEHTILRDAVHIEHAALVPEALQKGFLYCSEYGLNQAAFKVRVLKNLFSASEDETYSFFMGVVLCGEVRAVMKQMPKRVVIGGKKQMKQAIYELLKDRIDGEVICISDEAADMASHIGMIRIFEYEEGMSRIDGND